MSNDYEPKRESHYMGDEDDWRVLWPKSTDPFGDVFGKVNEKLGNDYFVKKFNEKVKADSARDIQVGGQHYKNKAMQPWDIIDAWGLDFYEGNVLKYLLRAKFKNGVEDLKKARHYLDKKIEDADAS